MLALVSVFAVVTISIVITRVATIALVITGMSRESARFQARSALTGVGFTTSEAEAVVNHPVRRRVVLTLMLVGSAGIASVVATLILSFAGADRSQTLSRVLVLVAGLVVLQIAVRTPLVDRTMNRLIRRALDRFTDLDVRDYHHLLHLGGGYGVLELAVGEGDWLANRCVRDAALRAEGIALLGIDRPDGTFIAVPTADTMIRPGDVVIAYAEESQLAELDDRPAGPAGDEAHRRAVEAHGRRVVAEPVTTTQAADAR